MKLSKSHRSSLSGCIAAIATGLAGFLAFNVVDGVFGVVEAIAGVAACVVLTIFVFRRSAEEEPDA
jgi:uncharacterized membrane protein YuzA (DUF378 family)